MIDRNGAAKMGRVGLVLSTLGMLLMVATFIRALQYTPIDANQGAAQKIFYVHAPAAHNRTRCVLHNGHCFDLLSVVEGPSNRSFCCRIG